MMVARRHVRGAEHHVAHHICIDNIIWTVEYRPAKKSTSNERLGARPANSSPRSDDSETVQSLLRLHTLDGFFLFSTMCSPLRHVQRYIAHELYVRSLDRRSSYLQRKGGSLHRLLPSHRQHNHAVVIGIQRVSPPFVANALLLLT